MKFISKNGNYMVVLRPGRSENKITGEPAVSGLHVRFQDGIADVIDPEMVEMMKNHRSFGIDFIASEEDPYALTRKPTEPEHDITEIEYGHVGKSLNPKPRFKINPEQKAMIAEMAKGMAMEMFKELIKKQEEEKIKEMEEEVDRVKEEEKEVVAETIQEEEPVTAEGNIEQEEEAIVEDKKKTTKKNNKSNKNK